jgi:hypothetical protein
LTAAQMNDIPQGSLGYIATSTAQGSITAFVDLTTLTLTVTVVAGRRIRIQGFVHIQSTATNDIMGLRLLEDGGNPGGLLIQNNVSSPVANWGVGCHLHCIRTPTVGAHTWKLQAGRDSGTGTITAAHATTPGWLLIEDIGT